MMQSMDKPETCHFLDYTGECRHPFEVKGQTPVLGLIGCFCDPAIRGQKLNHHVCDGFTPQPTSIQPPSKETRIG
jgi:hypothetical protein